MPRKTLWRPRTGDAALTPPRPQEPGDDEVHELDAEERDHQPAEAVDEHVAPQQRRGADGLVGHASQGERHEQGDDQGIEDDRGQDRRLGRAEAHHVEVGQRALARARRRVGRDEDRRQDREVLRDVVGDRERGQRAAGDQQLLADLDDLDELRRVGVEVDHVPRL
ncbi:MAG TPA: hypothetical protein PKD63_08370, partial [Solirubrobacteraceae bacterium]|nr:hypothetical protein [Solirubrobacteraceae bacterium]